MGGNDLRAFRAKLAQLMAVPVGGTRATTTETAEE